MFAQDILKVVVGHCSNNIGWHGIQSSSLDLLTEVLQKYMAEIGKSVHRYSEQCEKLFFFTNDALIARSDSSILSIY